MPDTVTLAAIAPAAPAKPRSAVARRGVGRRIGTGAAAIVCAAAAIAAWLWFQPKALPPGIAAGNGRIEATEIDIAAKLAGRIREVLAEEGDFVRAGQVLARMDTAVLEAQRREAEAQHQRARISVDISRSLVTQREAEKAAALALVDQRLAELDAARRHLARSTELVPRGAATEQRLDDDRAQFQATRAAVSAAQSQVAAADAAMLTARGDVIKSQADVEATRATIERIQADIDDSTLRSPRDGRVQYRVAEPGEVLAAGGRVLNLIDLGDVYMTFFLPTEQAGRVTLGADIHLILDLAPQFVLPAKASFVADAAQFTPKSVETAKERQKLMFRIKARVDPALLREHLHRVKTGLPGMAYVQVEPGIEWPPELQLRLPPP